MAHRARFELATPRFVVWCSIQLSYRCLKDLSASRNVPCLRCVSAWSHTSARRVGWLIVALLGVQVLYLAVVPPARGV